jgi:hypothetical protein
MTRDESEPAASCGIASLLPESLKCTGYRRKVIPAHQYQLKHSRWPQSSTDAAHRGKLTKHSNLGG